MSAPSLLRTAPLPALPHWEETPADLPAATKQIKAALRARIAASGRTVEEVFAVVEQQIKAEVDDITAARKSGEAIWPVIDYSDIEAGTVSAEILALLRRRGCLVVRGHFDRDQALRWDRDILNYVERNEFFENYRGPADDFFGSVGSKPEIYPIYWSPAQMQARQHDRMAQVQAFPQPPVEVRVRGRAVVRPQPGLAVPGPHPPPPAGRQLGRARHPPRPGHA